MKESPGCGTDDRCDQRDEGAGQSERDSGSSSHAHGEPRRPRKSIARAYSCSELKDVDADDSDRVGLLRLGLLLAANLLHCRRLSPLQARFASCEFSVWGRSQRPILGKLVRGAAFEDHGKRW